MANNDLFKINEESYKINLAPLYISQGFTPKTLVQFANVLPFHIPIKDGTFTTLKFQDYFISYHFMSILETENIYAGTLEPKPVEIKKTRVEITYASVNVLSNTEKTLNECFDTALQNLNNILASLLIISKNTDIHRVSLPMLDFATCFRITYLPNWNEANEGLFTLNMNVPVIMDDIPIEKIPEILYFAKVYEDKLNPFLVSEELMLNAKRQLKLGFYREAILIAQSSVESFLRTLYREFLKSEGKSESEIEDIFESTPFKAMVKQQFHSRIGGKWDPDATGPVADWYKKTYMIRNRIAHGGMDPTSNDANEAIKYAIELRLYIVSLIRKKFKQFPFLEPYFLYQKKKK